MIESGVRRRRFLAGAGAALAGGLGAGLIAGNQERLWRADVAVVAADSYRADLAEAVRRGLAELGLGRPWARGKTVLLKPNLIDPDHHGPQVNTQPALVRAVAEVFRRWDARAVVVAEGTAHCRDAAWLLDASGLGPALDEDGLEFVDLNRDEVIPVANRFGASRLDRLYLPATVRRADRVVSLAKLKTHHWAGVTLALKNLFGVMPGAVYGWPKNVLHFAGIAGTILDIHAAVRPDLAIIDGVVGMEGDGPINGAAVPLGALVLGTNLPAVDATAARLMGFEPRQFEYLARASGRLGPIAEAHIRQRGEPIGRFARRFAPPPSAAEAQA